MKTRSVALFVFLLPVAVGLRQAPKYLLRYGLVTGSPYSYALRDERAGRQVLLYVKEILTDSSGVKILTTRVDSALYLMPGGRAPQSMGSIPDFQIRTDDRRRWLDSVGGQDTILAGLRALALGRVVPLPQDPVGMGDSWKVEFPTRISYDYEPSNVATAKAKVKVKRVDVTATDTTVLLDVSLHLDGSQQPRPDWPTVDVSGDLNGEEVFSVHTGMTQHLKLQGRVEWSWRAMGPRGMTPHSYDTIVSLSRDV
ncbi:MAG TPA: hypothetical protein VNX15_13115, partial [Gemmatimonadales bacterium]|nr:hypothetical protein [Gemmatimonadales bacterium]